MDFPKPNPAQPTRTCMSNNFRKNNTKVIAKVKQLTNKAILVARGNERGEEGLTTKIARHCRDHFVLHIGT